MWLTSVAGLHITFAAFALDWPLRAGPLVTVSLRSYWSCQRLPGFFGMTLDELHTAGRRGHWDAV
jgi:hypothetical protein